jgi:class 3 adenylate cyclase/ligand-binding sensor domain-containing protein
MGSVRPILRALLPALALANFFVTALGAGFNPETGSYVFQRYASKQYGASPQNWAIAQDHRGVMYFGNTDGLLEFDGYTWRILRLPNRSIVRSISVTGDDTVYIGAQGDFGRLEPDASGTLQFVSLLNRLPEQDRHFADVWRILPTPQGIYFSTYTRLLRLNPNGTFQSWKPEKKFGRAFYILDSLYVQTAGKGLLRMNADQLEPVPGGERFTSEVINGAVPLDDGALMASALRLYRLRRGGVENFSYPAEADLSKTGIYAIHTLADGEIALGTRTGGLFLLNRQGIVDRVLSKASETLDDDFVLAIQQDSQGGVWLAQQSGLVRFNPGLSAFGLNQGLVGTVECLIRHAGDLYVGTTAGVFRLVSAAGTAPSFNRVGDFKGTVLALVSNGGELMAATDRSILSVTGARTQEIFSLTRGGWDLAFSSRDPNVIYAPTGIAVNMLRRTGNSWAQVQVFSAPGAEIRSVTEDADGYVWAASKGKIWRLDFSHAAVASELFGEKQGVPTGLITAVRVQNHVSFATTKGLRTYSENQKRFIPDAALGARFADGARDVFNVFAGRAGNVWVTGEGYHGILLQQPNGSPKWLPDPLLRSGIQEIYGMALDPDGTAWAIGADFILHRWDRALSGNPEHGFDVLTRRAQVTGDKSTLYGGAGTPVFSRLPWSENRVAFEVAAPFYEEPSAVEYQFRLEGADRDWSAWRHETRKDYPYLPEGDYSLSVRARSPHGAVVERSTLAFAVRPPWYRTWWAYAGYLVLTGLGVWGIVRWRTRSLIEEKKQLEHIVEERTVEIRQQRDEIHVQERKSHSLLLNILPGTVADELKATGSVEPVGFDDVTVCFTDFVGFTLSSEKLAPAVLVDALNEYFTAFDEIIARYGLEKLKTIGDSYMFASGLPTPRSSHAVDAVMAALEMVEVVKLLATRPGGTGWNIRVGLHSGPVVAGVVGIRKFAFDIWGNTVNFAARMESSGVPGSVNLSEHTNGQLQGLIATHFRGHVKIKEGRELPMFLADAGPQDPDEFARQYKALFGEEPNSHPAWWTAATLVS